MAKKVVPTISRELDVEVVGIERIRKIYGNNVSSYLIKTAKKEGESNTFFLKFIFDSSVKREVSGTNELGKFLFTPKIVKFRNGKFTNKWILFKNIEGSLMGEYLDNGIDDKQFSHFLLLEKNKEKQLVNLYEKASKKLINSREYGKIYANKLYGDRLWGERYDNYYEKDNTISRYFDHQIRINGRVLPRKVSTVVESIKGKYAKMSGLSGHVTGFLSHGDAHHGNIIISKNKKICFIDSEYWGYLPVFMELAKPYYNDFLGNLFFHGHDDLDSCFSIKKEEEDSNKHLSFSISVSKDRLKQRLLITEEKIKNRARIIGDNKDFLDLGDYLIMSHMLTKNPFFYPPKIRKLFLIFCLILFDFDYKKPSSIYQYF